MRTEHLNSHVGKAETVAGMCLDDRRFGENIAQGGTQIIVGAAQHLCFHPGLIITRKIANHLFNGQCAVVVAQIARGNLLEGPYVILVRMGKNPRRNHNPLRV